MGFEELYREHYERIYKYAFRLLADQDEARDVTQELFIKLYHLLNSNSDLQNVRAWLYRVVTKKSLAHLNVDEEAWSVTKRPDLYPDFMPYYHSLVVDSDNNLLVFEFTNDDVRYRFQVYSLATQAAFVCETELNSDEYEYVLNAGADNLQFHNGYLYAAIPLKNGGDTPVRLLKMELTN